MPEGHFINVLLKEFQDNIQSDQMLLPTLPEIAMKTQQITENPEATLKDVVEVVKKDMAISARLIKVANSPLIRSSSPVSDIATAIMRLGLSFSCNLITGLAIEQMFHSQTAVVEEKLREISKISTSVAGRASVLARHFTDLSPDEVALAGIVHLIGTLPILTFLDEKLVRNESNEQYALQIDRLLNELHADIGCQILRSWGFKRAMINVPVLSQQYDRNTNQALEIADIITLARLLTLEAENLLTPDIPAFGDIKLFERIGLTFEPNKNTSKKLEALQEEFEGAIKAFVT